MKRSEIKRKAPMSRTGVLGLQSHARLASPEPKSRSRKCAQCRQPFMPQPVGAKVCSSDCAVLYAAAIRAKAERKNDRARKASLKTRSDHVKEAQIAFNAYVRQRDHDKPCICCDKPLQAEAIGGGFDCGHYRSVGSAPHLRFDERNAHGQTKQCNRYGAGRAVDYRIGLIRRIGLESVEALEACNTAAKWTIEELIAIKAEYRQKLKELKGKL